MLALDRTTWKIGTRDVNYLVLAVVTRRFRVPLMWSLLDGPGNSATAARVALMTRYLALFPASTVRLLLADREFIGTEWQTPTRARPPLRQTPQAGPPTGGEGAHTTYLRHWA